MKVTLLICSLFVLNSYALETQDLKDMKLDDVPEDFSNPYKSNEKSQITEEQKKELMEQLEQIKEQKAKSQEALDELMKDDF